MTSQTGDGTLSDITEKFNFSLPANVTSNGVLYVDINNDGMSCVCGEGSSISVNVGLEDVYVTTMGGSRHYLFVAQSDGTFVEDAVARGAAVLLPNDQSKSAGGSIAAGDYDNDGYLGAFLWVLFTAFYAIPDLYVTEWRLYIHGDWSSGGHTSNSRLLRNRGTPSPHQQLLWRDIVAAQLTRIDGCRC